MFKFVVRRVLMLVPLLLALSVVLFLWVRVLPGGPVEALLGDKATPEAVARVKALYGLDRPIWEQYLSYLGRALHLDLGVSIQTQQPVMEEIVRRFPATVELSILALLIAIVVGIPLGYLAARRQGGWLDRLSVTGSMIGIVTPVFFLAFMLKYALSVNWRIFPPNGRQNARMGAEHPTGFYVLDGIVTGNWPAMWDALGHLVLPAVALGTIPMAIIVRMTRAAVLDVLSEDYVRTARAKGLPPRVIRSRHVLKNALLPIVTLIGIQAGLLLSGAVLTETVFGIPGMGSFVASAIFARDYSTIQGFILFIAVVYIAVNLLVDIVYGLIDPRIRVS
jgi:peptide/nickel transport system permease protein